MATIPDIVSTSSFGLLVGLSQRRIQQLVASEYLPSAGHGKIALAPGIKAFVAWRVQSERNALESEEIKRNAPASDFDTERTRKLRLENDETERLLIRTEDAIAAIDAIVGPIPAELAAVAPRITDDPALRRRIEDEIDNALNDVARRLFRVEANLESGVDALGESAEDDSDEMGVDEPQLSAIGRAAR